MSKKNKKRHIFSMAVFCLVGWGALKSNLSHGASIVAPPVALKCKVDDDCKNAALPITDAYFCISCGDQSDDTCLYRKKKAVCECQDEQCQAYSTASCLFKNGGCVPDPKTKIWIPCPDAAGADF
jgi:hypothetical protein